MKSQTKQLLVSSALILMMVLSATTAILPSNAQTIWKTTAYISASPTTIGKGQTLLINGWVYPVPSDERLVARYYYNYTVTLTKPDGNKDTIAISQSEFSGTFYTFYVPQLIGTYSLTLSFPGDSNHLPAVSQPFSIKVQDQPVQITSPVPLPTGYWTRPINAENREWYQVSGNWLQGNYDATAVNFNPYTKAPNTAHILWTNEVSNGGIIGGDYGSTSYGAGGGSPPVIMNGKVYYNMPGTTFRCVDLRTGKLLYQVSGSVTLGQIDFSLAFTEFAGVASPVLWGIGTTYNKYDALTGALLATYPGAPSLGTGFTTWYNGIAYITQQTGSVQSPPTVNKMYKWNSTKVTAGNWTTGVVWSVDLPSYGVPGAGGGAGANLQVYGDVGVLSGPGAAFLVGYNLNTGQILYNTSYGFISFTNRCSAYGKYVSFDNTAMRWHGYDMATGKEAWVSEPIGEYPWGSNVASPKAFAYGNMYAGVYDGHVYAIDVATGKLKWSFYCGDTTETPFNTWSFFIGPVAADGKVYYGTSEHTATQPRTRGNRLYCLDAFTGKNIWNISGAIQPRAVADSILLGTNEYDGLMYAFGKGQTETTVTVKNDVVTKGSSILIQGSVMDQSPAQPDTPAVSDVTMTAWMEYLHMQKAMPTNVQGVPVMLTATAPDGSNVNIGTAMTDGYGKFFYTWTPPNTGIYKIQATFAGSESYWSSTEETAVSITAAAPAASVSPSASPTPSVQTPSPSATTQPTTQPTATASPSASPTVAPPPPSSEAPTMTLYIALVGAAIAIVVIAAVVLFTKRRK